MENLRSGRGWRIAGDETQYTLCPNKKNATGQARRGLGVGSGRRRPTGSTGGHFRLQRTASGSRTPPGPQERPAWRRTRRRSVCRAFFHGYGVESHVQAQRRDGLGDQSARRTVRLPCVWGLSAGLQYCHPACFERTGHACGADHGCLASSRILRSPCKSGAPESVA